MAKDAFAAGDYAGQALTGPPEAWQTIAARGMIVDPLAGAAALAEFEGPEPAFYRAACHWIGGDEAAAVRLLEGLASPHAGSLLSLIRRQRIDVLAQLPAAADGSVPLLDGIGADAKFAVRAVAAGEDGRLGPRLDPARPPGFFLAAMVEGQDLPLDIGDLPCPTLGCTAELEAPVAGLVPWLRAFDHIIVGDHIRQRDAVAAITGRPVTAYPLLPGLAADLPPLEEGERDLDLVMAGALFSGWDPEVARFVQQLLRRPDLKLLLLDGAPDPASYRLALARSRITAALHPLAGAIIPQAADGLASGSIALVPRGSAHRLWGDEADGVFVYDAAEGPLPQIARILADYRRYAAGCLANARRLRRLWSREAVASRLFRFATVVAARPRGERSPSSHAFLSQRRACFVDAGREDLTARAKAERRIRRMAELDAKAPSPRWHDAAARELVLVYGLEALGQYEAPADRQPLLRALDILRQAASRYPDDLVLRFNLIRCFYLFGDEDERAQGIDLAGESAERAVEEWQVDPLGDIYPAAFNRDFVNTDAFCRLAARHAAGAEDARAGMRDVLLASLHHLLARRWGRADHARRAVELDPDFAPYRLTLAECLIDSPLAADPEPLRALLLDLAARSGVAGPALALLRQLCDRGDLAAAALAPLAAAYHQAERSLLLAPAAQEIVSSYFARSGRVTRGGGRGLSVHKRALRQRKPLFSFVLHRRADIGCEAALRALAAPSARRPDYQIVVVHGSGGLSSDIGRGADIVVSCRHDGFIDFPHAGANAALDLAEGTVMVVLDAGYVPKPPLLDALATAFFDAGAAAAGKPLTPLRRVVTGDAVPGFVAFRPQDALALGFFDEHPFFAGDRSIAQELAWRLHRAGVPSLELGATLLPKAVPPWWTLAAFDDRRPLVEWAARLDLPLFNAQRTGALAASPYAGPFLPVAFVPDAAGMASPSGLAAPFDRPGWSLTGLRWWLFAFFDSLANGAAEAARRLGRGYGAVTAFYAVACALAARLMPERTARRRRRRLPPL